MHEILFRGKRTDNGQWTYGFYRYKEELKKSFITIEIINENSASYFFDYEVIPETVGQFTGLRDKNDKKTFEGDILSMGDGNVPSYVFWSEKNSAWEAHNIPRNEDYALDRFGKRYIEKIIGNIYDNPELLEDKKK